MINAIEVTTARERTRLMTTKNFNIENYDILPVGILFVSTKTLFGLCGS